MGEIIQYYETLKSTEEGKRKFSEWVCEIAPFFKSIEPEVIELRAGFSKWSMKKRREVENHLATVHAIAMCNLCELTAGLCMEASIPEDKRWIPTGMNISYIKKAKSDLTASCSIISVDWDAIDELILDVSVLDADQEEVSRALIIMKVDDKKTG